MTTEEFLQKLKDSGNWREDYDYSQVEYKNSKTKIKVIDRNTGFGHWLLPNFLLKGKVKCSIRNVEDKTEYFKYLAKQIHGDTYDYSKVLYLKGKEPVIIKCKIHGEFKQNPTSHLRGVGCSKCGGSEKFSNEEFIKKAKEVHGDKYDYSKVEYRNNKEKVTVYCHKHGYFKQSPYDHLNGKGCNDCGNEKVRENKLKTKSDFIKKAKEVHGDKYDYSKVFYRGVDTKVTIICTKHGEFQQRPYGHLNGKGCFECTGCKKYTTKEFIQKAKDVHGDKYDYSKVDYINNETKVTIICLEHGEFTKRPADHIYKKQGCTDCSGYKKNVTTEEFIERAKEVHGDTYDYSYVEYQKQKRKIKLGCPEHGYFWVSAEKHLNGRGCPICNNGYTKEYKLKLIEDLSEKDLYLLDPFELSLIIQQGKLPNDFKPLVNTDSQSEERLKTLQELKRDYEIDNEEEEEENISDDIETEVEGEIEQEDEVDEEIISSGSNQQDQEQNLPSINHINDLHSLDNNLYSGMDEEVIDALVKYKKRKLWNYVLNDEMNVNELGEEEGGEYFTKIKNDFIEEYEQVTSIEPTEGYSFGFEPNLMQKLTVHRLLNNQYYGNWSGTGAGKTLSFILASRKINARLTVVIALNSTIEQTCTSVKEVYPDSKCYTDFKEGDIFDRNEYNYLIINYEKFQLDNAERKFRSLTDNNTIDFAVIDEIHNAKERAEDDISKRREVIERLMGRIREENENAYVLAMSATPVINNLHEAKSLLRLMNGKEYNDLYIRRTLGNALKMFQQLTLNGVRYKPKYEIDLNELTSENMSNIKIDGSHLLDELLEIQRGDYVSIEKLILDDKLNDIENYLDRGVILYSYFTTGIIDKIQRFVVNKGYSCVTYTGDENSFERDKNLKDFINGGVDILIGSKPIGTGVDGLQKVCSRMICLTLPWTNSEYEQLKGRIHRQGSDFSFVEIVIPQVVIDLNEEEKWSWDIQRLNLIKNKKTLADAAVDGIIPSSVLPTKGTLLKRSLESLEKWKKRLKEGNIYEFDRWESNISLYPEIYDEQERKEKINSEIKEFHRIANISTSDSFHQRLKNNPNEWYRYHALRKERMKDWEEVPYEYIATHIKNKDDIIADFGCGENELKNCIPDNKVYSFDHIAIDESVTVCDMKDTGLGDKSVDIAVFSLALWGVNYVDYLEEAYRILNFRGVMYIAESYNRYDDENKQKELIEKVRDVGFEIIGDIEVRGEFIYLKTIKS